MTFFENIKKFNDMYKMESNDTPKNLGPQRLSDFVNILTEEIEEHVEVAKLMTMADAACGHNVIHEDAMVQLADLLGDIIVYTASEMRRWGIPAEQVLDVIMQSNFSKLQDDGTAKFDGRGKLMKSANYWKPENKIKDILFPSDK